MCAMATQYNYTKPINNIRIYLDQSQQLVVSSPSLDMGLHTKPSSNEHKIERFGTNLTI
jgi:hypothetical protein